jgi:DNA polymerase-4
MADRKIIHVDLDAFFCAVEELRKPELKGIPFAVGGQPNQRGVVSSCSYPARKFGVHSAMPMSQAIRLCPRLVIVPADHHAYSESSRRVMAIFRRSTPLVEQISIDEAFLDVSDLPQPGLALARSLQASVHTETGLPCSLGVATNKLVAKIATDTAKKRHSGVGYPDAVLEVPPGQEAEFLSSLPVSALWGVGPKTESTLSEMNIQTIGDLANAPEPLLAKKFGKNGIDLARHARGIDNRPVVTEHDVKSISEEVTFDRDIQDEKILLATLRSLSEGVGKRMRSEKLSGTTFRLKLRWPNFTTLTRQVTLSQPVDQDTIIYEAAKAMFYRVWNPGKAVRLLGVGMSGLTQGARQLSLWDSAETKEKKLLDALDALHRKFGDKSVQLGYNFKKRRE